MTKFRIIDVETTGMDFEKDQVVEIGYVDMTVTKSPIYQIEHWDEFEMLIHPGIPIPYTASAIHHIIDEDVAMAPRLGTVSWEIGENAEYYAAHNASFEKEFLKPDIGFTKPWICTWKCAHKLYPDLESHSNQALRYALSGLNVPRDVGMPHRALPDCRVTARILLHFLGMASVEDLVKWSGEPVLLKICKFGKHKDSLFKDVPKDYLAWAYNQSGWDEDTRHTIAYYLHGPDYKERGL